MSVRFCFKLALSNLFTQKRLYTPYIITAVGMTAMFYIMQFLYRNKGLEGSGSVAHLREMMLFGCIVAAFFITIFLLYTNGFVVKQRSREYGLYGILGLEKRHVGRIMLAETFILFTICLFVGLIMGILLSKAMFLLLLKLLNLEVKFGFEVPIDAIFATSALFTAIFSITVIWNLFRLRLSQPVELLRAGKVGEREPRIKWFSTITGVLFLGSGYAIAQLDINPLEAIPMFFIAVMLVVAGTYQVFTAGSIALLKKMRMNKTYYYRTRNFISVSGMIYRMRQNAVGLGSICILSTAVLIMLSTTVSMYAGMEDVLRTRFARNISVQGRNVTDEQAADLDELIERSLNKDGLIAENNLRRRYRFFLVIKDSDGVYHGGGEPYNQNRNVVWTDYTVIECVPLSEYNRMRKSGINIKNEVINESEINLDENEVLIYSSNYVYEGETVIFEDLIFKVKSQIENFGLEDDAMSRSMENYYLVVSDTMVDKIATALGEETVYNSAMSYINSFDLNAASEIQIKYAYSIASELEKLGLDFYVESSEASRENMLATYGGLLFLGIFLGSLFIVATILIIYYKQVSEGYHDRDRFAIMQKVGLTKPEVRSAIRSQVLSVFYLPLVISAVHVAAAYKLVTKLLAILNLTNTGLFAFCTIIIFLVFTCFYSAVYGITARVYYRIVGEQAL